MKKSKYSLRTRIFLSMIFLVLGASILIAAVTIFQYREEALDYHRERLERKEDAVRASINYHLRQTSFEIITRNIPLIFREKIYEIKDIHNLEVIFYDLEGNLLKSSKANFFEREEQKIPEQALEGLKYSINKKYVERFTEDGVKYRSSYTYVTDNFFKPLAILHLPYIEEDDFITRELNEFLMRLTEVYIFMMLIAITLSYFLSKHITKTLKEISGKMKETRLDKTNKKIFIQNTSEEIATVVTAYNDMIDELESSAAALAASERETAWREMAKQVAHEIKNPLTPMRLTVQNFERKFDCSDPNIDQKVKELSTSLIQQIDIMSSIASAFSTYANMPAQKDETLNLVKITKLALDIFNEDFIHFSFSKDDITVKLDRTQLIRIVTNLVKNAIHSVSEVEDPKVDVAVFTNNGQVVLTVSDNGVGIPEEHKHKVFEPKFTTKSSGMGLGLAMVKSIVENYQGSISYISEPDKGTVFTVIFPKFKPYTN